MALVGCKVEKGTWPPTERLERCAVCAVLTAAGARRSGACRCEEEPEGGELRQRWDYDSEWRRLVVRVRVRGKFEFEIS